MKIHAKLAVTANGKQNIKLKKIKRERMKWE